ncbi:MULTISPECIES: NADH-quinone oxidoreductase subunit N [unclassified Methanoregula]|uniref:NADH-quinone oxidoreductase subunit N n=1 Tax=unclassified Methanoregula TaxID=2649730 RepID=UPI0009C951D0|nr:MULTISPECIES: NADH-quinone oxidoreductase subunit N [unclassified Methanoregula]OPX64265.1 MAG: F(420)H(2) dehydrogenase subunit N [Methanoregula sp. PtaB.Bin085]OPY33610.1 MAG: F(420)H(2) dehydrogenase subunit N [Methanoregula sp. PtaU1.Bin006]
MNPIDIAGFMPFFIALCGIGMYFLTKAFPPNLRHWCGTLTGFVLLAVFCLLVYVLFQHASYPTISYIGLTGGLLVTGIGAVAAWASAGSLDPKGPVQFYYPLFLFALAGAMAVGFATDLFTIFVLVELSAIPVYALVAYRYQADPMALSAAMKYLLQGVTGTLTALLGVALLFVEGHTLEISRLPAALAGADARIVLFAALLIMLGYGVKLGIVPLHTWLPDAYARAPVGVTAIMVGPTKIGVLIAMVLSLSALPAGGTLPWTLGMVITFIAVVTMTAGNLLALNQTDLRYILSYSSIAQMGYILLGFGIGLIYNLPLGFVAGLYYAIAYSMMKSGAFFATDAFARDAGTFRTEGMGGLGARHPVLGFSMVVFVFGLIGVPFTSGFLGKLLLEQAGMVTSMAGGVALALILALNSALSLGYYIPVISTLLFCGSDRAICPVPVKPLPLTIISAVAFLALVTIYFGLFPESFEWISHAAQQIFIGGVP